MDNSGISESLLKKQYKENNYMIQDNDSVDEDTDEVVVIYFSSNGLFYPDNDEEFTDTIMNRDRYEWETIRIHNVRKSIWVRDIYKQYYVSGINESIDSMDKLIDFLRNLVPDGYRIYTVGSSAGGYAALVVGLSLRADVIIDFCGQNSLKKIFEERKMINKSGSDQSVTKFFETSRLFEDDGINSSEQSIYYIYSDENIEDKTQAEYIKDKKVRFIPMKSKIHGASMLKPTMQWLINISEEDRKAFYLKNKGRVLSPLMLNIKVGGVRGTVMYIFQEVKRIVMKKSKDW